MTRIADSVMVSSPLLTELVRTLSSVPDPAGAFASSIHTLRAAEGDLQKALADLEGAHNRLERQVCLARRNQAMLDLIVALQTIHRVLQHEKN